MNEARKVFLRRLGGSFLVGAISGPSLDVLCQLLVRRGDVDQLFPPVFGLLAAWSVFFYFWNRLGQVRVEGFLKWLAIGTSIGIAAGAVLGAIIYPLLSGVLERTEASLSANNDPDL
ncbi:MAG TPA: hypothetical protein VKI17_03995, partial [Gemmataceae bacterium]|nr:hypothetical protein [Gemmataceae bacterium]